MYEVAQGKNYAKITLSGSEIAVKFPNAHDVFAVKGEDIQVALTAEAVAGADGTYNTADGDGQITIAHYTHADTLYIKGTGTAIVWGGQAPEACPFKKQAKGGDITVTSLSVTTNGTYTAEQGTAYSPVVVDVQEQPWQPLQDGYSNFWFELTDDTLSPWLNFSAKNADAVIDWGDGSGEVALDTLTPTHTYSKAGKYVVKVKGVTGIGAMFNSDTFSSDYSTILQNVELNNEVVTLSGNAFWRCLGLENVGGNAVITSFSTGATSYSTRIKTFTPLINARNLQSCFYVGYSLQKIVLGQNVESIANNSFINCICLGEVHVQATTPPTLGSPVFTSLPNNYIIYVPVGYGETYKSAAGWSAYSEHILEEGQTVTRAMQRKFASDALKAEETEIEEKR
jgi:hypothetical protein